MQLASRATVTGLRGVTHRFSRGGPAVLADIDLNISAGDFVCLIGPSGCGKSTLLALLAGLEQPTEGTVTISGGRSSLVFQEHALFSWLTAAGNVELALEFAGVPRPHRRERAIRLLESVRLAASPDARIHELSGGMRQRVAIARALAQDAGLLLMDEPFAALDAITRDALHEELLALQAASGCTVVFVTHDVTEAVRLGRRVILLGANPGRIVGEWRIDLPEPGRLRAMEIARQAAEITARLQRETAGRP